MKTDAEHKPSSPALLVWRLCLILLILQGIGITWLVFDSRSVSGAWMGLSSFQLVLIGGILGFLILTASLLGDTWLWPAKSVGRIERISTWLCKPGRWGYFTLLAGIVLVVGSYCLTLLPEIDEPFTRGVLERLLPLIAWLTGFSAISLAALLTLRNGKNMLAWKGKRTAFWVVLVFFSGLMLAWIWASRSSIPAISQLVGWNRPGVPVVEYQVFIAWGFGMAMLLLANLLEPPSRWSAWLSKRSPHTIDLGISICLWLSAVLLWQGTPISPSWFVSEKLPPNFAYYPYSDARNYDLVAQSALIGEGYKFFNGWDVRRPLHALYLTLLHRIAGQAYERVTSIQVLILAFLPVLFYLLTRSFYNRASGVFAAVLVILREANSIRIAGEITASHAKLLMVDLPVTLAVVFFAYLAFRWLKNIEWGAFPALVSGGALGLAMLIRLETFALAFSPALIAALLLLPRRKFASWFKQMALFLLGMTLVISPWIWRNWQRTGMLFIDSPYFRYSIIHQRFRPLTTPTSPPNPTTNGQAAPAPTAAQPDQSAETMILDAKSTAIPTVAPTQAISPTPTIPTGPYWIQLAARQNWNEAIKQPKELARFAFTHYLNSQVQMLLIFPTAYRSLDSTIALLGHRDPLRYWDECCSLVDYTRRLPYWKKWTGAFPSQSILPILFSVLIIAGGIQLAWKRHKLASLMPVFCVFFYLGFNALLRNSGGRYILPVDWAAILYYSLGIILLSVFVIRHVTEREIVEDFPGTERALTADLSQSERLLNSPRFYAACLILLLIGCAIPLLEFNLPQHFTIEKKQQMRDSIWEARSISAPIHQELESFLGRGGQISYGRALYPQYFAAGVGSPDKDEGPLAPKPYPRLVLTLIGDTSLDLSLPIDQIVPEFPNAADAVALYCPTASPLAGEPLAVFRFDAGGKLTETYLRSPFPGQPACPLPEIMKGK